MQQAKRHHFVPRAYLKSFCDEHGKLRLYRKDNPNQPLHQAPGAALFRTYYYSQPTPDGGQDNNALEAVFCSVETPWPETVAKLHARANVNDRLESIFQFIALQRVRVPASRDLVEAVLAQTAKDTLHTLMASGRVPPPPPGLEDLPNQLRVAIDPHRSILAMVTMLEGMGQLFSHVGLVAVHNDTDVPFLTSDNPVLWFDASLPFEEQRPYTIQLGGPILLLFPVSPKLALVGSTQHAERFLANGLQHSDVTDVSMVNEFNRQVCRFAYEAVIARETGWENLVAEYAAVSPVHEAVSIPMASGLATIHRMSFGPRSAKPKFNR
jgi:hypothetical protein